jgi:Fe-S-cluster containining protein
MDGTNYESEEIFKLDLEKYGLSHLEGKNILTLTGSNMDDLLNALGDDDVSLNVPLPCTPYNVQEILAYSECRRCGKCCTPNPLNPASPGIEAFKEELESIAAHLGLPYETLHEKTNAGKYVLHPFTGKFAFTRWLPLPCMFYDAEQKTCRVHPVRPVVCQIYPVIFTGDPSGFSIKLNCDYGKELLIGAYKLVRQTNPDLEITL